MRVLVQCSECSDRFVADDSWGTMWRCGNGHGVNTLLDRVNTRTCAGIEPDMDVLTAVLGTRKPA